MPAQHAFRASAFAAIPAQAGIQRPCSSCPRSMHSALLPFAVIPAQAGIQHQ
jgi:hypothetical protein